MDLLMQNLLHELCAMITDNILTIDMTYTDIVHEFKEIKVQVH